jgi:glucose/arabinose dehydrogenase
MKKRLRFKTLTLVAIIGALLLSACDSGNPTATPIPQATATISSDGPAPNPTVPVAVPTGDAPVPISSTEPNAQATPGGTGGAGATATPQAAADAGPLALSPVTIETTDATRAGVFESERHINLPPGFHIEVYATSLRGVRWLGLSPDGMVYATARKAGTVVTLPDADGDGTADSANVFADDLGDVHGIAFKDNAVYVANEGQIIRLEDTDKDGKADKQDVIADDLPTGGGHSTRTIAFGPDGKLYVSAGSSCNVCKEDNEKRAAISLYSAEGAFEKVYASGLRNAVGIVFHPITGELWATNNGRDGLGDDIPPEAIYNVKDGVNFGWPYCYGNQIEDTNSEVPGGATEGFCGTIGVPSVEMQAHSAPLGLGFYTGDAFPASYKGDLFVAFHGSWNRSEPTGYKVVRIRFQDNLPDVAAGDLLVEDFATGWFDGGGWWGRPVNPMMAPDGSLLLTDDAADAVYRIYYEENAGP